MLDNILVKTKEVINGGILLTFCIFCTPVGDLGKTCLTLIRLMVSVLARKKQVNGKHLNYLAGENNNYYLHCSCDVNLHHIIS